LEYNTQVVGRTIVPKKNVPPIVTLNIDELFNGDDGDEEAIPEQTTSQQTPVVFFKYFWK
jgi:hypothetical protein